MLADASVFGLFLVIRSSVGFLDLPFSPLYSNSPLYSDMYFVNAYYPSSVSAGFPI